VRHPGFLVVANEVCNGCLQPFRASKKPQSSAHRTGTDLASRIGHYHQLTRDSGSGDRVGAFESRVAAVGPEVGYVFKYNDQPAYCNVRGYWEYSARNRVEGYALFATLSIPLGSAGDFASSAVARALMRPAFQRPRKSPRKPSFSDRHLHCPLGQRFCILGQCTGSRPRMIMRGIQALPF
jgi:outer membrane putative beta-barrel porin/alpha-amylase